MVENNKEGNPRKIINMILEDIKNGKFVSGELLPSQKELCKIFNTGRGSIREALQALELTGVVEIKPGKGVFVSKFTFDLIFNPARLIYKPDISILPDILEFRELFEIIVVSIAVKISTTEDFNKIQEILDLTKFYCEKEDKENFSKMDYEFHKRLAESTHNKVIKSFFSIIFPLLKYSISETTKIPGVMIETYEDHKKIFNYIKKRDAESAKYSMREHMKFVKKYVNKLVNKMEKSNI